MTARQHGLRILVVENEILLRLVAEDMLLELGHEIIGWASTAQEAIAQAERTQPDIVLMDIQLDGQGDGIDAAREISNRLGIVSLFMTGCGDPDTHKRALLTRPLGYLQKPLSLADLDAALHRLPSGAISRPALQQPDRQLPKRTIGELWSMSEEAILRMSGKVHSESFE